ncbi:MAG: transporter [Bacteroidetes bacterium]|nr:MAG: transporter [Bacteroidota bacterium]
MYRKKENIIFILMVTMMLAILASCVVGPEYARGDMHAPDDFRTDFPDGESIANLPWWELYQDTVLQNLIEYALENNRNLEASISRILAGHAQVGIVRSGLYPRLDYSAGASGNWTAKEGDVSGTGNFTPAINISYEVDLWGKIKHMNDAEMHEYLATKEAYNDLLIIVIAQVAEAYLLLRDLDNRLIISENTAETWEANLDIVQARLKAGMVSEVDVNQAIIQLSEARASIQLYKRLRAQTENAISTLLGLPPQSIERGLPLEEQLFPPEVPAGMPSALLDRRPDMREAEHKLAAQTARIGVAEALKYPSLVLSADMAAQFANPVAGLAGLSAQLFGPLLNAGANRRRHEMEIYRTEQVLYGYEQAFLGALREVEDAMIAVETYKEEYRQRQVQVTAANQAVTLTWVRYESGLTNYIEVLDLQRSQFSSQLKASETLQLQLTSIVRLYLALGGGWYYE